MGPSLRPRTYQDVKATLRWYSPFPAVIIALFLYFYLVPDPHHAWIASLSRTWVPSAISAALAVPLIVALSGFIGWLLIFVFEIHDKVYERHIIRWRHYYDLDFILPALTRPFGANLDPRLFEAAEKDLPRFMKPFYHFVGDDDHEHSIGENTRVRFYETVVKYWITQINEIVLLAAFLFTVAYVFVYRSMGLPLDPVVFTFLVIITLFVGNRILAEIFKASVRRATLEEVEEIHSRFLPQLENQLKLLHERVSLQWRN
jgi:hypothetical protein